MKSHLRGVALLACAAALLASTASAAHAAGKITGGSKVDRAEYDARWRPIVSLRTGVVGSEVLGEAADDSSLEAHFCGGTLVRPDVVVTAAHCVTGAADYFRLLQGRTRVLIGTRTLVDGPKQPGQLIDVVETRVHPEWRGSDDLFEETSDARYDVAVLRLATPVVGIPPMPMVSAAEDALWGNGAGLASGARLAGWGVTNAQYNGVDIEEADSTQTGLREVELPLLADRECESTDSSMGRDAKDFDRATMICGYRADTDPRPKRSNRRGGCYGDSGGPLAVPAADGSFRLAGIVSWGPDTAGGCNRASVFTRVAGVRDFVDGAISDFGQPAPALSAAAPTTATQVSASSMRLEWPAAVGTPRRYNVLQDVPLTTIAGEDLDDELDDDELTPAGRAFLRSLRILMPVGGGGSEARSLLVEDVEPRRPGATKRLTFRIEVRDGQGRRSLSPPLRTDAPIDAKAPVKPVLRRVRSGRGAPVVTWRTVADNDCVRRYVVEVRRAGRTAWTPKASNRAYGCGSNPFASLFGDDSDGEGSTSSYGMREPLYRLAPGGWSVRVTAYDRAGNRSSSRPIRIRSTRSVPRPRVRGGRCFPTDEGMVCVVTPLSTSTTTTAG